MAPSHQEEPHSSPPSVDFHTGEHRGGYLQQTYAVEVGFQTSPIRVLEDLPEPAGLAHTRRLHIQQESSGSKVHDLGARPQGNGNQCPGLLFGSNNLVIPPGAPQSSCTGGGFTAADRGNSDISGVGLSNVVASLGQTEDIICSNPAASGSGLP